MVKITKAATPKPFRTYSAKSPINTSDTLKNKTPSAKLCIALPNKTILFESNFILSNSIIINPKPNKTTPATNNPCNI